MIKAYAYVRYSSTVQADGDSVERQVNPLEAFERKFGIKIEEVFLDAGVSSFRGDNARKGQLKVILDRIEKGSITRGDYIVVESIDRITRQRLIDGVELIQSILKKGIRIYTTFDRQTYSYDDPDQDFKTLMMISLIAQRANEESATKSRRRKSAWNKAKLSAAVEGKPFNMLNPPYGLRFDTVSERFVIEEDEANEIRTIFSLLKVMGVSRVIKKINESAKRKWNNKAVQSLIKTKYPLGVLMSQRRDENRKKVFLEFVEGYYPNIITHTDYNSAVSAMTTRRSRRYYGVSTIGSVNIFKHVVKCGKCGQSLIFEKQKNQKGELYTYYNCLTKKELKGNCDQRFRFDLAFGMLMSVTMLLRPNQQRMTAPRKIILPAYAEKYLREKNGKAWGDAGPGSNIDHIIHIPVKPSDLQLRAAQAELGINLFSLLGAERNKSPEVARKLRAESEKLARLKTILANLEQTLDASIEEHSGKIPDVIIRKLTALTFDIESQKKVVDGLSVEHEESLVELPIASHIDLIEKFSSEEGRLELNGFFIAQKLDFQFVYDSKLRVLKMNVMKDGETIISVERNFLLHKPLREFGIDRLRDLYESEGPITGL